MGGKIPGLPFETDIYMFSTSPELDLRAPGKIVFLSFDIKKCPAV